MCGPSLVFERVHSHPSEGREVGLRDGICVLQQNSLELIIRSHPVKDEGFEMEYNGQHVRLYASNMFRSTPGGSAGSTLAPQTIRRFIFALLSRGDQTNPHSVHPFALCCRALSEITRASPPLVLLRHLSSAAFDPPT